jgi:hypothetical protein
MYRSVYSFVFETPWKSESSHKHVAGFWTCIQILILFCAFFGVFKWFLEVFVQHLITESSSAVEISFFWNTTQLLEFTWVHLQQLKRPRRLTESSRNGCNNLKTRITQWRRNFQAQALTGVASLSKNTVVLQKVVVGGGGDYFYHVQMRSFTVRSCVVIQKTRRCGNTARLYVLTL